MSRFKNRVTFSRLLSRVPSSVIFMSWQKIHKEYFKMLNKTVEAKAKLFWLCGVIKKTPRYQWHQGAWLSGVTNTAEWIWLFKFINHREFPSKPWTYIHKCVSPWILGPTELEPWKRTVLTYFEYNSLMEKYPRHCWVWLRGVHLTKEFFAYANISTNFEILCENLSAYELIKVPDGLQKNDLKNQG